LRFSFSEDDTSSGPMLTSEILHQLLNKFLILQLF
jgi:hypothetical protein